MKPSQCPVCTRMLDHTTPLPGARKSAPAAGDFSLCCGCGAMLRFEVTGEDLGVRLATAKERDEIPERFKRQMIQAQHLILLRAKAEGANVLAISADSTLPHVNVPCDRCGRTVKCPVLPEAPELDALRSKPSVVICTGCMPHAREVAFERGAIVFPPTWAATARRN